ncbi:unnamed protein product [Camellia sinensis]
MESSAIRIFFGAGAMISDSWHRCYTSDGHGEFLLGVCLTASRVFFLSSGVERLCTFGHSRLVGACCSVHDARCIAYTRRVVAICCRYTGKTKLVDGDLCMGQAARGTVLIFSSPRKFMCIAGCTWVHCGPVCYCLNFDFNFGRKVDIS